MIPLLFLFMMNASATSLGCLNLLGATIEHQYPGISESLIAIAEEVPVGVESGAEVELAIEEALWKVTRLAHHQNHDLNTIFNHIFEFGRTTIVKSQKLNSNQESLRWSVLDFRDFIFRLAVAAQFPTDKTYIDLPIKKRFGFNTPMSVELVIKHGQQWYWFASNKTDLDHLIEISKHLHPHFRITVFLMCDGLLIAQ